MTDRPGGGPRLRSLASSTTSAEHGRTPLWLWPTTSAAVAAVAAVLLGTIHPEAGSRLARWSWPGDHSSATTLLQVLATSAITVTSLTFSLVMIALQLASQQFSPRLLRVFTRDPLTKAVLATLVATLVFCVATLRQMDAARAMPSVNVLVASVLGLATVLALVLFLAHMSRTLRVDSMMVTVHHETRSAIEEFHLPYGADGPPPPVCEVPEDGEVVTATSSGFVQRIDVEALVAAAADASCRISVAVRPGDHVVLGTPLAWIVPAGSAGEDVAAAARDGIKLAYERTLQQDPSFGFRQLTDVSVKALSPGINDPVTAATAVGHMSDLLVRLTGCRLGPTVHGLDGTAGPSEHRGVVLVGRDLRYYLDLMCGQIRRYGSREPTVLIALLRALRDLAAAARDDHQRGEVRRQIALIVGAMDDGMSPSDRAGVHDVADRVELALAGHLTAAFADRAGETRSL